MKPEAKRTLWILAILIALVPLLYANAERPILTVAPAPVQPIDFFHRVHAGVKQIQCQYCHRETAQARFAGMPSTQLCIRCHRVVIPNHPQIQKLHAYYDQGRAVPWVRVTRLPNYVIFNHQAHIAANVPCEHCHGNLATMDRVRQVTPMNMGWCVQCHRSKGAPTACVTCHH